MIKTSETKQIIKEVTGRQKVSIIFLAMLLVLSTFLMTISNTTAYAGRSSDLTQINKAKAYLINVGTLKPVEGIDTSVVVMAQTLVNKVAPGVTVKAIASSNLQVKGSTIVYGSNVSSGEVTFTLTKKYTSATQKMLVIVPATKISSEPVVTEPVVTAPVVTEPVVTAPVVTEPVVTAPVVTEPTTIVAGAYYVSKSGNDLNAGTAAAPWRTIQKAANTAAAGNTVYIMGGTYNEKVTVQHSGTSGSYITFAGYPGESVVIDGTGVAIDYFAPLFSVGSQSYIKIQNLKVTNSGGQGIGDANGSVDNGYITVENCSTYRTQISGVHFYKAHNIVVDGVYIDTANLTADQESLSLVRVYNFEIKNCTVVNGQKEGIDAKDGCSNGKIYNNTVKDASTAYQYQVSIYVDASGSFCRDIEIYNNTITNCKKGVVVAGEVGGLVTNINVHDNNAKSCNIGYEIAGWGATSTNPMSGITFNRNTASGTTAIGVSLGNPYVKNVIVTNNTLSGLNSTIPIYLEAGSLSEITIDGNTIDRIIAGQPTGTNYILM